jgi:hypothetical protein
MKMPINKSLYYCSLLVLGICLTYTFIFLTPQARVRHIAHEYYAAIEQLNQSPPGIQRADEFLRRIKTIDTQHAPLQIQQDFQEYANTLDQALRVLKKGGDASVYDKEFGEEKAKLDVDFKKYI